MMIKTLRADRLEVFIHDNRSNMGKHVAQDVAAHLRKLLAEKETVHMVFAAAPSQMDFLESLRCESGIDWKRVTVFHMDEYIGISIDHPQSFAGFVKKYVADALGVGNFYPLNGAAENIEKECARYTQLLREKKIDIVCLGIGENGHIAFNDPGEADFWDEKDVKTVKLDEVCRQQQVHDKCFASLDEVPAYAMTLTVPALMRANAMFCTVPARTKAEAVRKTMSEPVDVMCPASALRLHQNAKFYCDQDSASLI